MRAEREAIPHFIQTLSKDVSDLFLSPRKKPHGRIAGKVVPLAQEIVEASQVQAFLEKQNLITPETAKRFADNPDEVHLYISGVKKLQDEQRPPNGEKQD